MTAQAYGSLWSDAEFRVALDAYARVLRAERRGAPLKKSEVVDQLMQTLPGRTRSSIDYRLRNISAVRDDLGADWIEGYKPMSQYPRRLYELVRAELEAGSPAR